MKRIPALLLVLVIIACNLPNAMPHIVTPQAAWTVTPTLTASPSPSASVSSSECAYEWARHNLDELSLQFTEALKAVGLAVESARAEAYGEDCVAADNSVVSFGAMETDYYVTLVSDDLSDEAKAGDQIGEVLDVIDNLPEKGPGGNPGMMGITFKAGDQTQDLWFSQQQAKTLRTQGVKGAELYKALAGNK